MNNFIIIALLANAGASFYKVIDSMSKSGKLTSGIKLANEVNRQLMEAGSNVRVRYNEVTDSIVEI